MKIPVVIRYEPLMGKWYIVHEASYQNAFSRGQNGYATRDEAEAFAEANGCKVKVNADDPRQQRGNE